MGTFPSRLTLYRTAQWVVISVAVLLFLAPGMPGQGTGRAKANPGPRALGLVELAPDGKAHLIPIAILYDGTFYDAGAYKATPVPMAIVPETVYEGVRSGVSQGLFTVTAALHREETHQWMAEGKWQPTGSSPSKGKESSSPVPRGLNDESAPPVLRHSSPAASKAPESLAANAPAPQPPSATPPAATSPTPSAGPAAAPAPTAPTPATSAQPQPDKDTPLLHRGKPEPKAPEPLTAPAVPPKGTAHASTPSAVATPEIRLIPAISDAHGGELRSYAYSMKPEEEQQLRKKMLELAADDVRAKALRPTSGIAVKAEPRGTASSRSKKPAKAAPLDFQDVQFHVFDLTNSNEPTLVLSASTQLPSTTGSASADLQYMVTLVARQDVNGDFHRATSVVTDTQHLDIKPRLELIDAVDADGDGRGELLFRQVSDTGSAFVIYRVIGDRLYPLFQGIP